MGEQELYWKMHFCNSKMFKTIAQIEMYTRSKKKEGITLLQHKEEHIHYYMTEYGQIFKFDKENITLCQNKYRINYFLLYFHFIPKQYVQEQRWLRPILWTL